MRSLLDPRSSFRVVEPIATRMRAGFASLVRTLLNDRCARFVGSKEAAVEEGSSERLETSSSDSVASTTDGEAEHESTPSSHSFSIKARWIAWRNVLERWWKAWKSKGFIFMPNWRGYKVWWLSTVVGSILSGFIVPYEIAFPEKVGLAPYDDFGAIIQYILESMFFVDICVTFNLAYRERNEIVMDRRKIAKRYIKFMFWVDLLGVFPLDILVMAGTGDLSTTSTVGAYLGLLRLLRLIRLYRFTKLVRRLQYNHKVSLLLVTFIRDLFYVLFTCNMGACGFYFIARQEGFGPDSWIRQGPANFETLNTAQRYIVSLYWAMSTFETIGFGDYFAVSSLEQVWVAIYVVVAVMLMSYVQTSFLLFAKTDTRASDLRDAAGNVAKYCSFHLLEEDYKNSLLESLQVRSKTDGLSDENILQIFPGEVRQQILRRLYLGSLLSAPLFEDVGRQFLEEMLANCDVELFLPGVDVLDQGRRVTSLYILVEGTASSVTNKQAFADALVRSKSKVTSIGPGNLLYVPGDLLGDFQYFTGTLLANSVHSLTACKVLVLDGSKYKQIASSQPRSGKAVLKNLLRRMEELAEQGKLDALVGHGKNEKSDEYSARATQRIGGMIESLLATHVLEESTALRFAAAQGDAATVRSIIRQGINVNIPNDEGRTALMIAAAEGDERVLSLLLDVPGINVNARDSFGRTALREAVENKHTDAAEILLNVGADLGLCALEAAKRLSIAIYEKDQRLLAVLLLAGAPAASQDYCGRSPLHIAAICADIPACALLLHHGANPQVADVWGLLPRDYAIRAGETRMVELLDGLIDASSIS